MNKLQNINMKIEEYKEKVNNLRTKRDEIYKGISNELNSISEINSEIDSINYLISRAARDEVNAMKGKWWRIETPNYGKKDNPTIQIIFVEHIEQCNSDNGYYWKLYGTIYTINRYGDEGIEKMSHTYPGEHTFSDSYIFFYYTNSDVKVAEITADEAREEIANYVSSIVANFGK